MLILHPSCSYFYGFMGLCSMSPTRQPCPGRALRALWAESDGHSPGGPAVSSSTPYSSVLKHPEPGMSPLQEELSPPYVTPCHLHTNVLAGTAQLSPSAGPSARLLGGAKGAAGPRGAAEPHPCPPSPELGHGLTQNPFPSKYFPVSRRRGTTLLCQLSPCKTQPTCSQAVMPVPLLHHRGGLQRHFLEDLGFFSPFPFGM